MRTHYKASLLQRTRTAFGRLRRHWQAAQLVAIGKRLAREGRQEEALTTFKQAFDLNPSTPLSIYEVLGDNGESSAGLAREAGALQMAGLENEAKQLYALAIARSGNYRESQDLDALLRQVVSDDHVVITQLAVNYFPMFEIWYRYFVQSGGGNLLVIALDPVVYRLVRQMGIAAYLLPVFNFQAGIRDVLWLETVKFRKRLIDRGVDYLHTDIDAFWLKNPVASVRAHKADIVASIGHGTPEYAVNAWGFVMCLGFYLMRSNPHTRKLYPSYVKYTEEFGHDQNGLNTLLWERGTVWRAGDDGLWQGTCEQLQLELTVLPDAMISRTETVYPVKPLVLHPQLESNSMVNKLRQLAQAGIT